jgi:tetratricopeptide (TPR) repeat protein
VLGPKWLERRRRAARLAGAALAATALSATAQTDAGRPRYTDGDWALLPVWCIDTQDGKFGGPSYGSSAVGQNHSPRSRQWTALFGADFWHMHHICRAMYHEQRSRLVAMSSKDRVDAISRALSEYAYIVQNCSASMRLMPEVYYRIGELYLRVNDVARAGEAFLTSRRLKPDYWPSYSRWADQLVALKLRDQARSLVEEGLSWAPGQPELMKRFKALGGTVPPPPRVRQEPASADQDAEARPLEPAASASAS